MTKLKKPILIIVLICFITVSSSVLPYKKAHAIVGVDDAIIFLVLTALAVGTGGALVTWNNATGNDLGSILQSYRDDGSSALDDDDFAQGIADIYSENADLKNRLKYGTGDDPGDPDPQISPTEEALLISMLTKQGYEYGSELFGELKDYYEKVGSENNIPDSYTLSQNMPWNTTWSAYANDIRNAFYVGSWQPTGTIYTPKNVNNGSVFKYTMSNSAAYPQINGKFFYTEFNTSPTLSPTIKIIFPSNVSFTTSDQYVKIKPIGNMLAEIISFTSSGDNLLGVVDFGLPDYIPPNELPPFLPPDPVLPEESEFLPNFYNIDMSAFNGLGFNQAQIMDILKGNMTVSQSDMDAITKAAMNTYLNYLENPVSTPGTPTDPQIDPTTGQPIYGHNFVVDPDIEPNVPPDNLTGLGSIIGWLKTLWNTIKFLPTNISNLIKTAFKPVIELAEKFWQQMEIWAHDNLYVHWVTLQNLLRDNFGQFIGFLQGIPDFLLSAPGLIGTWWTTEGLPDLQALFDPLVNPGTVVPPDVVAPPTWSDFYTPIKTTIDFKFPWLFPQLHTISGFYEEPFDDIYANIKIGPVQGNYKLIDMSFINDNKEQVKDTIRAFLMILIWLYNVSMAYKLLRGSELLKSSITGVSGK